VVIILRNKRIVDAWNKIEPGQGARERMLAKIREQENLSPAPLWPRVVGGVLATCMLAVMVVGTIWSWNRYDGNDPGVYGGVTPEVSGEPNLVVVPSVEPSVNPSLEPIPNVAPSVEPSAEPEVTKTLNEGLLSDIGSTFEEIKARRGRLASVFTASGGLYYTFENGYGSYFWGLEPEEVEWDGETWPLDENGNIILETAPLPKSQFQCRHGFFSTTDLFLGLSTPMLTSDVEHIYGISYVGSGFDYHEGSYNSTFKLGEKYITIYTDQKGFIAPNALVSITLSRV